MLHKSPRIERAIEITLHLLTWSYVFTSPLLFKRSDDAINWQRYLHGSLLPLITCIAFYLNYFLLIPRLLLANRHLRWFFIINLLLFAVGQFVVELTLPYFLESIPISAPRFSPPPKYLFVLRGFITFVFAVGASVALRLSMQWHQSEKARAEAELRRSEAELSNLKNQINPHFLLNTLNNIYALTAFDSEKAQNAIIELSRMLRYMLYENQTDRVCLNREIAFLQSYVELMKLRIDSKVEVLTTFDVPAADDLRVAPLIFISLVENAFKHGISPTEKSFIHLRLEADRNLLRFTCTNSNFPKNKQTDKAPGGIGLKQVSQRLNLSYPGHYTWKAGLSADGKTYHSEIIITT